MAHLHRDVRYAHLIRRELEPKERTASELAYILRRILMRLRLGCPPSYVIQRAIEATHDVQPVIPLGDANHLQGERRHHRWWVLTADSTGTDTYRIEEHCQGQFIRRLEDPSTSTFAVWRHT